MNQDNKNKLLERFPKEWFDRVSVEIGDGWFDIVYNLLEKIEPIAITLFEPKFKILQIKEKFGYLRIYTQHGANETIRAAIIQAERESGNTCEECGKVGTLRNGAWLKVRCDGCYKC